MKLGRTGVCLFCILAAGQPRPAAAGVQAVQESTTSAGDNVPLFRVFLKDGTSLVSYGEMARLDDHVVFTMPTSASASVPQLQLINIPSDRVDWERTLNYAESVRSSRYLATRAEDDYALLTNEIGQALSDVSLTNDPKLRLEIVEKARRTLAEWPAAHYNYKRDDIQQMLGTLDEAIASLRAAIGSSTFDLSFVAPRDEPAAPEPILPAPDPAETIEQTLRAARLTTSSAERLSLLTVALHALGNESAALPAGWVTSTRAQISAQITKELEIDRQYKALGARMLRLATARARMADVRGVQRVLTQVKAGDEALGSARPEAVASIVASVEEQLDGARRLRLERDSWALRAPELRAYELAIRPSLVRLEQISPLLEDIKSLAGSGPSAIGAILRSVAQVQKVLSTLEPPSELRDVHSLFTSAVQLADNAAKIRREAALTGSMSRAWDASSAAAGALMLAAKARVDLVLALTPPRLQQ